MYSKISKSKSIAIFASSLIMVSNMSTLIGSASILKTSRGENASSSSTSATEAARNINEGNIELDGGGKYLINGNGSPTNNKIIIHGNIYNPCKYDITFKNVNIKAESSEGQPMPEPLLIEKGAEVNMTLIGKNILRGDYAKAIINNGVLIFKTANGPIGPFTSFCCVGSKPTNNVVIEADSAGDNLLTFNGMSFTNN